MTDDQLRAENARLKEGVTERHVQLVTKLVEKHKEEMKMCISALLAVVTIVIFMLVKEFIACRSESQQDIYDIKNRLEWREHDLKEERKENARLRRLLSEKQTEVAILRSELASRENK